MDVSCGTLSSMRIPSMGVPVFPDKTKKEGESGEVNLVELVRQKEIDIKQIQEELAALPPQTKEWVRARINLTEAQTALKFLQEELDPVNM